MNKAVFLDKDGTLIKDVPYNVDPLKIDLIEGVGEALKRLKDHGYKLIMVTNQAGVARGYFEEHALPDVFIRIQELLKKYNVEMDHIYYCPHHPEGSVQEYAIECECRKPKGGLIQKAMNDYQLDPKQSWMVGDILNDVQAGKANQCHTILFSYGKYGGETEWKLNEDRIPDFIAYKFEDIADIVSSYEHTIIP